mmetsp:Transcript_20069/g.19362  ORF Transcript_20069/g.19362 Transcript_20069/m.19362 type:complete len:899 (+) Transcript_20069:153-2849(+)|eukprot:CAMPEP_0119044078 /NCGR_PEP_ID=MMETSP1177-20130426/28335_1 /TAXON_ID=2985 /ORGANISM="Ochromonas sp, Strain CCMP1899" /LENGTH=898 /DNA_ID=CAMNT_0007013519 /DNA_START=151 /DNA_END=2847 /DNA_ORIENTATION=-
MPDSDDDHDRRKRRRDADSRDKDGDRKRSRDRDDGRKRNRDSSPVDREKDSRGKGEKEGREKDRGDRGDRERDSTRDRDYHKDKERDRESDRHNDRDKDREKDRKSGRDRRSRSHDRENRKDESRDDRDKEKSIKSKASSDVKSDNVSLKATVTDNDGEISCSVDETNRIRALLGIRPLNLDKGDNEKEAVENFRLNREREQKVKEAAILKEALEKSREKRLLNTKMSGNTLGEAREEGELVSAADWVRRSRKKEKDVLTEKEKAKLQAELAEKRLQEEEEENSRNDKYNSKDLKGMQVMHSVKDFDIGSEIILTLADSNILDKDEDGHVLGVAGEADFLENVNMTDNDRRLEREKRAKRLKQPVYQAYDDAEFAEGGGPGTKQSILSQYDQDKKSAPKFELGEGGESQSQLSEEVVEKKTQQSLMIQAKEISDYYTKAEYTSFTKSKGDGKEKKKRKVRKKEEIEYADLDEEEGKVVTKDRGSRKIGGDSAAVISTRMVDKKKEIYKEASKNAEEKSMKAFKALENILPEEDDDADMALSLARARRLALAQQNKDSISLEDEAAMRVKELVARSQNAALLNESKSRIDGSKNVKAAFDTDNATGRTADGVPSSKIDEGELALEEDSLDAEGRRADGTLVFTSTTEFTSRLQARLTEKARARAEAIVKAEAGSEQQMQIQIEDELGNSPMEGSSGRVYQRAKGAEDGEGRDEWVTMDVEGLEDADSDEDEQLDFGRQQSFTGMAATLALLKSSGELNKGEDLAGRSKDGRVNDPSNKVDGVKLEYRDEFGRKLTQKEAFRQICYRFHGYGPGKKAKEKRLRQMDDQSKALSSRGLVDSGTMQSLVRAQEATGKAHVTIQGGEKASGGGVTAAELLAQRIKNKAKGSSKAAGGKSTIAK